MDFNSLKEQVSNLTLYDLKAGVRKVQNAVMNFTEMEAKVREATNNEPWGASSTLMQEIADGTFSYSLLNEIMPMIYKRFTDKSAEEWRQIYKALQLLEFLIKNGSERVIDDARSHLTLLKMLRQFHYIDQNGKDQGINVRNRAKELAELLSDVDRIRAERKKARATRNKYTGLEGGSGLGSSSMSGGGGGGRFGGFGSGNLNFGGYSGGVYGDGGGFGGATGGFQDSGGRRDRFEEYDEYDDGAVAAPTTARRTEDGSRTSTAAKVPSSRKPPEPPKAKAPEVDLLSVDEDDGAAAPRASVTSNGQPTAQFAAKNGLGAPPSSGGLDDDDFDDFQSAAPPTQPGTVQALPSPPRVTAAGSSIAPLAAPTASTSAGAVGWNNLAALSSMSAGPSHTSSFVSSPLPPQQPSRAPAFQGSQPNYFTSVSAAANSPLQPNSASRTTHASTTMGPSTISSTSTSKPTTASGSGDAFGSLWSTASAGVKKPSASNANQPGPNLASMAKEKASAGIWGATSAPSPPKPISGGGQALMNSGGGSKSGSGGALDDLLG